MDAAESSSDQHVDLLSRSLVNSHVAHSIHVQTVTPHFLSIGCYLIDVDEAKMGSTSASLCSGANCRNNVK